MKFVVLTDDFWQYIRWLFHGEHGTFNGQQAGHRQKIRTIYFNCLMTGVLSSERYEQVVSDSNV